MEKNIAKESRMSKTCDSFIKILFIIVVIAGIYFIAAKKTNIDLPNWSVSLADSNGNITVDINRCVKSMDDVVLSTKRNDGTIIYNI